MITMLYRNFMPIISLIERMHTDFEEWEEVPTKAKLHMEKTILARFLNASTYLPRVHAKVEAFDVAAQNRPLTDVQAESKQLLLGLKVLLKGCRPAAFRIGVLVQDCNWAGKRSGKCEECLSSAGVQLVGCAFFGGRPVGECGVHQDIAGCSGDMAALALLNTGVYSH